MPRPRHAQGRPDTRVIPTDWETTHRPVAEKTMTASVALARPATGQHWDETTKQKVANAAAPYATVSCRVQQLTGDRAATIAAEDPEAVSVFLVTVPADTDTAEGDHAAVAGSGDPLLDGRRLTVRAIARGSLRFERDLFCTLTT